MNTNTSLQDLIQLSEKELQELVNQANWLSETIKRMNVSRETIERLLATYERMLSDKE